MAIASITPRRASKPLRSRPEPQPRGAKVHGNRPIDQAEAAARFIAAPEHEKMHDERLWDLRQKRDREMHGIPEWEELRSLASAIKEHTLTHLDSIWSSSRRMRGRTASMCIGRRTLPSTTASSTAFCSDHGAKSLIKSKSMLTEECGFRPYMASVGIEVIETDLGERIQQLDNEDPSHVVVPAVHKLRTDVAEVFSRTIGTDPANSDVHYLAEAQREATRPLILEADAGHDRLQFRRRRDRDLCRLHQRGQRRPVGQRAEIAHRLDRYREDHPAPRASWQCSSACCRAAHWARRSHNTPRISAGRGKAAKCISCWWTMAGPSVWGLEEFWTSLKCIRCGACMNTCPVYRRSGGLSYGATYSGPIGLIIDPTFNQRKYSNLPFASTLNGSCSNVCPVKINIHEQIYAWRRVLVERHETPLAKRVAMKAAGELLSRPAAYRAAIAATDVALAHLPRFVIYNGLNAWGKHREVPHPPKQTFHSWYQANRGEKTMSSRDDDPGRDPREQATGGAAASRGSAVR